MRSRASTSCRSCSAACGACVVRRALLDCEPQGKAHICARGSALARALHGSPQLAGREAGQLARACGGSVIDTQPAPPCAHAHLERRSVRRQRHPRVPVGRGDLLQQAVEVGRRVVSLRPNTGWRGREREGRGAMPGCVLLCMRLGIATGQMTVEGVLQGG